MKIYKIVINNYRSLYNVTLFPKDILALVGRNNSGKSNVLKSLQLFFEPSVKLVNKECFHNHNIDEPIDIFVSFSLLSDWEKEQFKPWMDNEKLIIGRRIIYKGEDSFDIIPIAVKTVPKPEWLQEDNITGEKITNWWDVKDTLIINELDFGSSLGPKKPTIAVWKEAIKHFVEQFASKIPMVQIMIENPKGYPGVLKGALPEFIYIPAVRDILEEAKVAKTNPFGKLINSVLEKISQEKKDHISAKLKEIEALLNRSGGDTRIDEITKIEGFLNNFMNEVMECDIEIELGMPQLREVLGSATIYADDGIRTTIETKGHGLQRSMIFTIFRAYAEWSHVQKAGDKAGQRSTVFAIEEPEIYMHPQSQRTLMSIFRDIAKGNDQIFYSTQSSLFIDISHFDEICIMRRDKIGESFKSNPKQLFISNLIDDLKARKSIAATEEGIREQYAHVFNPMINEGFFADKVIIAEGPSELYSLPIYGDCINFNFDKNNISVVHANGKGQMDRLLRIFNGFEIPTFLIFDGDKNNTDSEIKRKTLELLLLLGAGKDNIESVVTEVSDNFSVFEYELEETLKNEIDGFELIIQEGVKLLGPISKPLKNRYVANTLKKRIESGESTIEILPTTIIEVLNKVKELSYCGSILCKLES